MRLFAQHHAGDGTRLLGQLESGDTKGALFTAHSLKGVAGTLGLHTLQAAGEAIEQALRAATSGLAAIPMAQALEVELDALIAQLGRVLV